MNTVSARRRPLGRPALGRARRRPLGRPTLGRALRRPLASCGTAGQRHHRNERPRKRLRARIHGMHSLRPHECRPEVDRSVVGSPQLAATRRSRRAACSPNRAGACRARAHGPGAAWAYARLDDRAVRPRPRDAQTPTTTHASRPTSRRASRSRCARTGRTTSNSFAGRPATIDASRPAATATSSRRSRPITSAWRWWCCARRVRRRSPARARPASRRIRCRTWRGPARCCSRSATACTCPRAAARPARDRRADPSSRGSRRNWIVRLGR
jgi:hypothetical protein